MASSGVFITATTPATVATRVANKTRKRLTMDQRISLAIMAGLPGKSQTGPEGYCPSRALSLRYKGQTAASAGFQPASFS